MEIKYQTGLRDNPVIKPTTGIMATGIDFSFTLEPLTIDEIIHLEINYNSGNPFPTSLRELLSLAGKDCYVLDYSTFDSQIDLQNEVRADLMEFKYNIARPFFVLDVHYGTIPFLFVYLDQPTDDPPVYMAELDENIHGKPKMEIRWVNFSLSSFINDRVEYLKAGGNPF
ncbi:hypothetical protein AAFN85_07005 [Mucilaginibacter sp. CAU 1740]|uniref:hypothetical protein n=1 Tax=Mucilaginibacter sp. CAU 1740 TaxID=3140365 RepID=UPI00325A593D